MNLGLMKMSVFQASLKILSHIFERLECSSFRLDMKDCREF
jgi:hypothetical protein